MSTWHYYNHALLSSLSPSEVPDVEELNDKNTWKIGGGHPLFARWTSDYDCGYETEWWYCIKDEPFDIMSLKAHWRYKIKKGIGNFEVRVISPNDYKEELYQVQVAAFSAYPESYRPKTDRESFFKSIATWFDDFTVFGAFDRETGRLQGYSMCKENKGYIGLNVQKTNPVYEKKQINAALVYGILEHYKDKLSKEYPLVDGERNVLHETAFEDYLARYFGFRKAYCKLHIKYRGCLGVLVHLVYPFRGLLKRINSLKAKQACAVLKMEEIIRHQRRMHD